MSTGLILTIIILYFVLLFAISFLTGRKADEETFFRGNKSSPWYLVAFGMIGASLSGVTFISIPGWVEGQGFAYMQIVLGYLVGYFVISRVLMPMYYRKNLTSIYGYLEDRFGPASYKTGASFFLLSRIIGASFRLFLVAMVLDAFVLGPLGIPFWQTVLGSVFLIWIYTFRGGIKTVVWTDTLQTAAMLLAAGITVWVIKDAMGFSFGEMISAVSDSSYSEIFHWDISDPRFFFKQFYTGAFIAIVMTGLDQDMMQKNLTCKTLKDAQKNMETFSIVLVFVNLVFLVLGALLYMYGMEAGAISLEDGKLMLIDPETQMAVASGTDKLFPHLALNYLPPAVGILFIIGLIAAAYSSADSALTALTTSFCIDILNFEKTDRKVEDRKRLRMLVHVAFSLLLFFVILIFHMINDQAVIASIFTAAGYTYGPLLGLYAFGMLTKMRPIDAAVPVICILSPFLTFGIETLSGNWFGFSVLILNGVLTFLGLYISSLFNDSPIPPKDAGVSKTAT